MPIHWDFQWNSKLYSRKKNQSSSKRKLFQWIKQRAGDTNVTWKHDAWQWGTSKGNSPHVTLKTYTLHKAAKGIKARILKLEVQTDLSEQSQSTKPACQGGRGAARSKPKPWGRARAARISGLSIFQISYSPLASRLSGWKSGIQRYGKAPAAFCIYSSSDKSPRSNLRVSKCCLHLKTHQPQANTRASLQWQERLLNINRPALCWERTPKRAVLLEGGEMSPRHIKNATLCSYGYFLHFPSPLFCVQKQVPQPLKKPYNLFSVLQSWALPKCWKLRIGTSSFSYILEVFREELSCGLTEEETGVSFWKAPLTVSISGNISARTKASTGTRVR